MTLLRLLAIFTLLVFSGQSLLPALHHALTPHEVCAEHGHLMHSDTARAPGMSEASTDTRAPVDQHREIVAPNEEGHAHEHCAACGAIRLLGVADGRAEDPRIEPCVTGRAPAPLADVCVPDGLGLYRLAPKQGPPRAS